MPNPLHEMLARLGITPEMVAVRMGWRPEPSLIAMIQRGTGSNGSLDSSVIAAILSLAIERQREADAKLRDQVKTHEEILRRGKIWRVAMREGDTRAGGGG